MRFSVTPLGGARGDLARVVDGIVRYLQPPPTAPAGGSGTRAPTADGPSRYYADSGEEPGRWLGRAAEEANLTGEVRPGDFAAVLAGRDPHTGERLITAQGSAGRRPDLGVGNATRRDPSGELLFGEADVAAALGMTRAEVARLLEAGAVVRARAGGPPRVVRTVVKMVSFRHPSRSAAHTSGIAPIPMDGRAGWP